MAGSASARILFPYNNISIRKLRENRAPKARREKQASRLVLTSRDAMLMGEGKKAALVLHYICPIMEFVKFIIHLNIIVI